MNLLKLIEKLIQYYHIVQMLLEFLGPFEQTKNIVNDDLTKNCQKWKNYPCKYEKN